MRETSEVVIICPELGYKSPFVHGKTHEFSMSKASIANWSSLPESSWGGTCFATLDLVCPWWKIPRLWYWYHLLFYGNHTTPHRLFVGPSDHLRRTFGWSFGTQPDPWLPFWGTGTITVQRGIPFFTRISWKGNGCFLKTAQVSVTHALIEFALWHHDEQWPCSLTKDFTSVSIYIKLWEYWLTKALYIHIGVHL